MRILMTTLKVLILMAVLVSFSAPISFAITFGSIPPIITLMLDNNDVVDAPSMPSPSDAPAASGKPGPNNTGPSNEDLLVDSASVRVRANWAGGGSGTAEDPFIVENLNIAGSLKIEVPHVVVRNFRVAADGLYLLQTNYDGVYNVLIEDGEVMGGRANTSAPIIVKNGVTLRRLEIHESGGDGVKVQGSDFTMEGCWVYNLGAKEGSHADGVQGTVGSGRWSNHAYRNNFFDMAINKLVDPYQSNITVFLHQEDSAPAGSGIDGVIIENNWLIGGNFSLTLTEDMSGVVVRDNKFGRISDGDNVREVRFGHIRIDTDNKTVSGNVYEDTGELIPNQ